MYKESEMPELTDPKLEDKLLGELMAEGRRAPEIAITLQRTTRSIRRRAELLNLSWRACPRAIKEIFVRYRKATTATALVGAEDEKLRLVPLKDLKRCRESLGAQFPLFKFAPATWGSL